MGLVLIVLWGFAFGAFVTLVLFGIWSWRITQGDKAKPGSGWLRGHHALDADGDKVVIFERYESVGLAYWRARRVRDGGRLDPGFVLVVAEQDLKPDVERGSGYAAATRAAAVTVDEAAFLRP